jgi:branched-chain amino acid transport system substrate-binding protein
LEPAAVKQIGRPCVGLVAIALWFGSGSVAEGQPPIRIGASLSQTGSFVTLAQDQLRSYELCIKHANEKGGVLGRRIELHVQDDQSNTAAAVAIGVLGYTSGT